MTGRPWKSRARGLSHDDVPRSTPSNPRVTGETRTGCTRGEPAHGSPGPVPSRRSGCSAGPVFTKMPPARLSSVGRPAASRPRALPWIDVAVGLGARRAGYPPSQLPEIRLPAPAAVPPITLFGALLMKMPSSPFGIAAVPSALVPMRFPCTWFPDGRAAGDLETDDAVAGDHVLLHGVARRLTDQDADHRTGQAGRACRVGADQVALDDWLPVVVVPKM